MTSSSLFARPAVLTALVVLVYLHNTLPLLTMLPRINVDEPWLIERAYQLVTTGSPSQPMFLLNHGYLLQPGHSLVLAPWIQLFGVGLWEARLLAVVCGLGAVLSIFALGRLLFGTAAGAIAAMFIATDSNVLGIARMARTDAPSLLFVALALATALHGLRTSRSWWTFAGGLATGMAILCHANSYWVGVIVFFWYVAAYGWRIVLTPSAYAYAAGLLASFGPYVLIVATNWQEFNAQLTMFAIERVPGFSLQTLWYHISHEPLRYRDWYFGLITNDAANPILWIFQASAAAGTLFLAWRVWNGRRGNASVRPETLAAILVFGSMLIFAALIPNKALVYLPHLLVGLSIAAGALLAHLLSYVPWPDAPSRASAMFAPAVLILVAGLGAGSVVLYQSWYRTMQTTELRPYEETHALLESMVPSEPMYLIASPTFWLPFYDRRDVKFVAYTAAGPYDTVEPQGFFTRQRIFDFPADRPFYLLVDEVEWRTVLEDTSYDPYWRQSWIAYIRNACTAVRVAFGTAHGTIALFRCWDDRRARPQQPEYFYRGVRYHEGDVVTSVLPAVLAQWQLYRPDTALQMIGDQLNVSAPRGGGIYADLPVTAGTTYLLKADVNNVSANDMLSIHEIGPDGAAVRSQWVKLSGSHWFPSGTVIRPSTNSVRVYLYSESATRFNVRALDFIHLSPQAAGE